MPELHHPSSTAPAEAIRQALEILSRASADWRGNDATDPGPLHWPVAVTLARRELAQALEGEALLRELLQAASQRLAGWSEGSTPDDRLRARIEAALGPRRVVPLQTPLTEWLCGAGGNEYALDPADARAGIAWWNSITPTRRREWLEAANSARPVDAWNAFKAGEVTHG
jgi:hypothetical protein